MNTCRCRRDRHQIFEKYDANRDQFLSADEYKAFLIGIGSWGKHKYKVKAFMARRWYWRSYEGSATVYIISIISVLGGYLVVGAWSTLQLIVMLILVPPIATLAEAISPHTWDSASVTGCSGLAIALIELLP